MPNAYTRSDADGNVIASFDFPDVGEFEPTPAETMDEKLARFTIEQAIYKMIAEDVSTKTAGNLRSEVNEHYLGLFRMTGAKSFELRLGDSTVGTVSIKNAAPRPTKTSTVAVVTDSAALNAYNDDDFNDFISRWVGEHIEEIGKAFFAETGALPDGMELVEFEQPAQVPKPTVSITVHTDKVADVVSANQLGGIVHGMLGGE